MLDGNEIIAHMSNQKINYDSVLRKMIAKWQAEDLRPKILIHSCCAPCSTYTLEFLTEFADVTVYYANSNIYPESEYRRRALVQRQFIDHFNEQTQKQVAFIEADYKPNEFVRLMQEKRLTKEPEGGLRCSACFQMRLDLVAEAALAGGYDYFGSSLTISPKKNAQLINEIGFEIQKIYDVNYLPSDFKKQGGYQRSLQLCKDYDVYRQCYCGCIFAGKQQGIDFRQIHREASAFLESEKAVPR